MFQYNVDGVFKESPLFCYTAFKGFLSSLVFLFDSLLKIRGLGLPLVPNIFEYIPYFGKGGPDGWTGKNR